jgi:dihydrofolate reductase
MGLLTFSINVTLDGCVDHRQGIADDEAHDFFTRLMSEGGAMLWGRVTYEMMESYWPAVARGDEKAPSPCATGVRAANNGLRWTVRCATRR